MAAVYRGAIYPSAAMLLPYLTITSVTTVTVTL